jgi:hypothetical protein
MTTCRNGRRPLCPYNQAQANSSCCRKRDDKERRRSPDHEKDEQKQRQRSPPDPHRTCTGRSHSERGLARREGMAELVGRMLTKHQPEVAFAYYNRGTKTGERAATEAWNAVMEAVRLVRPP